MSRTIVKQGHQIGTNTGLSRRSFIKGATGLGFTGLSFPRVCNSALTLKKPNIVIMFLDNIGYGDLACYGNQSMKTPRIDRLASEGVRCTDFYIGSPSCMPSRGALLTGRAPSPHKYLYWSWGNKNAAIRKGRYKLIRERNSTNQDWQLFDLQNDIGETANLFAAKSKIARQLKTEYERWEKDVINVR